MRCSSQSAAGSSVCDRVSSSLTIVGESLAADDLRPSFHQLMSRVLASLRSATRAHPGSPRNSWGYLGESWVTAKSKKNSPSSGESVVLRIALYDLVEEFARDHERDASFG